MIKIKLKRKLWFYPHRCPDCGEVLVFTRHYDQVRCRKCGKKQQRKNKANNAVENLQWLTAQENIIKAFKQGRPHPKGNSKTDRRGHRSPVAKLNEKQVLEIKEMLSSGTTKNREIAKIYNVSEQLICNIKKGRNYAY